MDGYTLAQAIQSLPNMVDLPIVALTANALNGDREYSIKRRLQILMALLGNLLMRTAFRSRPNKYLMANRSGKFHLNKITLYRKR